MPSTYYVCEGQTFAERHRPPGRHIYLPGDQQIHHVLPEHYEAVCDLLAEGRPVPRDYIERAEFGRPTDAQEQPADPPDDALYHVNVLAIEPPPDFDPETYEPPFMSPERRARMDAANEAHRKKHASTAGQLQHVRPRPPSQEPRD